MKLNPVTQEVVNQLRANLPARALPEIAPHYLQEPRGAFQGQAGVVVAPAQVDDVAKTVQLAAAANVPIVPYGGGTGLVGGQTMPDGPLPILLSLERMNRIRGVFPQENILIAEAGCILQDVQNAAVAADRLFPLSLASEGSCRIGGNLSTNAGGVNVLRYGNARDLCLGLEAVLPNGQIWHGLKRLRKDNTGYDLRNLLVGGEGTLGVITAASLRLFPRPNAKGSALLVVKGPDAALALLGMFRAAVGDGVNAFELINGTGLEFLRQAMPDLRQPFPEPPEWMVLVDLGLFGRESPDQVLMDVFQQALEQGLVLDGLIAQNEQQRMDFWNLRENLPVGNKWIGAIVSNDVSVPIGAIAEFINRGMEAIAKLGDFRINCFGHLGDGNLHYNVFAPIGKTKGDYPEMAEPLRRIIHDLVAEFDGSFSAEHGVGRLKVPELERYGDPARLSAMRAIKTALDPQGVMNPGAVLRAAD